MDEGEVLVGSGRNIMIEDSGVMISSTSVPYLRRTVRCSKCIKNIHCCLYYDQEKDNAKFLNTCTKNFPCKCKCRTHYECRQCGRLHPYGVQGCTSTETATADQEKDNAITAKEKKENDEKLKELMDEWRKCK